MSRPARPVTPPVEVTLNKGALDAASAALTTLSVADEAVIRAMPTVRAIGQIQALEFIARVSDVAIARIAREIKNANGYKDLVLPLPDGTRKFVSTFDDFCEAAFGKTGRRVRQLMDNLALLGEELYEQSERLNFRARDYQALKALPHDAQDAVKQVIASGDKEAAVDLLHDFAERVTAAEKRAEEAEETCEAKDRLLEVKNKDLDKARERKKFKPSEHSIAQTHEQQQQLQELHEATNGADVAFLRLAHVVEQVAASESTAVRGRANQAVQYLVARLAEVIDAHGIEVSLSEQLAQRPEWLDPVHPSYQG